MSCVEHGSDEQAVLILSEVIHQNLLVGRQWAGSSEHVLPASPMAWKINNYPAEGTSRARDTAADLQRSSWSG
jgi:hypothetical protein